MPNLVLLGIGHTNADILHAWERQPIPGTRLLCISRFPTATYSGMLPGALAGQFTDAQMRIDLQALARRAGADLWLAEVTGLDLENRSLLFRDHAPIDFESLSVGVGSMPRGWDQHQSPALVPVKPMQTFLRRLDDRLDAIGQLGLPRRVAVVGGGTAGVEIALCLRSRLDQRRLDQRLLDQRLPSEPWQIALITNGPSVATDLSATSQRKLIRALQAQHVELVTERRVTQILVDRVASDDGWHLLAQCVVLATGAVAPPVLERLGLDTDGDGFLQTRATLQTVADDRIFAVGDSGTIVSDPHPKAGVYAVRQAPVLWGNLRAQADGGMLRNFRPQKRYLRLLNTGDGRALLDYYGISIHARWCWHLKTWIDLGFVRRFQSDA